MTLRCVVVDDNDQLLGTASELLHSQGMLVVGVATTSAEAELLVETLKPDVVLVDVILGEESGFDLVRRLAARTDRGHPPAILMSTHDEVEFADLVAMSPAIGFLSKSDLSAISIRELLDQVRGADP